MAQVFGMTDSQAAGRRGPFDFSFFLVTPIYFLVQVRTSTNIMSSTTAFRNLFLAHCLALQLLPSLTVAHGSEDAQAPLHSHEHVHPWRGCLPGPLQHPSHPICEINLNETASNEPSTIENEFAPWTHRPYCAPEISYCVFTNAQYPTPDKGVSIVANPDDPTTGSSLSALADLFLSTASTASGTAKPPTAPAYKITPLPGRGLGLIATRRITQGEVLMIDHAALVADSAFPSRVKRELGRSLFERAIGRLSAETRGEVMKLARSGDEDGCKKENVNVEDVVKTNSFTVTVGGGSYMVLFPRVAVSEHIPVLGYRTSEF